MPIFPSTQITDIPRNRFYVERDYEQITDSWEYEDGGKDFNEVADAAVAPRRWQYVYDGLTPEQAEQFDEFNDDVRLVTPFTFIDKYDVAWSNVFIKEYKRTHEAHKSWVVRVEFNLVGYNSQILTAPTVSLTDVDLVAGDVVVTGTVSESSTLKLYINNEFYILQTDDDGFTFTVPLEDLIPLSVNSFRVVAINGEGALATSNTLAFSTVIDTEAPTVPGSFALSGSTSSGVSFTWTGSTDNVEVESYEIQYATDADFTDIVGSQIFDAPATEATVTELTPDTPLYYRNRAKDTSDNYSDWTTNEVTATTSIVLPPLVALAPVTPTVVVLSGHSIIASTPPADAYPDATGDWLAQFLNANSRYGLSGAAGFRTIRGGAGDKTNNVHNSGMGGTSVETQDTAAPGNYDGSASDYETGETKKYVTLPITNNIFGAGMSADDAYDALVASVDRCHTANPTWEIYVMLEIFRDGYPAYMVEQDLYNQKVRDFPPANATGIIDTRKWNAFNYKYGSEDIYYIDFTHLLKKGNGWLMTLAANEMFPPVGGLTPIYPDVATMAVDETLELLSWEEHPEWTIVGGTGGGTLSAGSDTFRVNLTATEAGTITLRRWGGKYASVYPDWRRNADYTITKLTTPGGSTGNGAHHPKGKLSAIGDYCRWLLTTFNTIYFYLYDDAANQKIVFFNGTGGGLQLYQGGSVLDSATAVTGDELEIKLVDDGLGNPVAQVSLIHTVGSPTVVGTFTEPSPEIYDMLIEATYLFDEGTIFNPVEFSNREYEETTITAV